MNHRNIIVFQAIKVYTADFFEPFVAMQIQEEQVANGISFSPWMIAGNITFGICLIEYRFKVNIWNYSEMFI